MDIDRVPTLDKKRKHSIEVVVDRLVVKEEGARARGGLAADRGARG